MVYKFSIYFEFDSSHCPFLLDQLKMRSLKKKLQKFLERPNVFVFGNVFSARIPSQSSS